MITQKKGGGGEKKKKGGGNTVQDHFKCTLTAFWYDTPFFKRERSCQQKWEQRPYISGEISFKQKDN